MTALCPPPSVVIRTSSTRIHPLISRNGRDISIFSPDLVAEFELAITVACVDINTLSTYKYKLLNYLIF
jgi:hypothetical protein